MSLDGGFEEFDEFLPSRATSASNASTRLRRSRMIATNSSLVRSSSDAMPVLIRRHGVLTGEFLWQ